LPWTLQQNSFFATDQPACQFATSAALAARWGSLAALSEGNRGGESGNTMIFCLQPRGFQGQQRN